MNNQIPYYEFMGKPVCTFFRNIFEDVFGYKPNEETLKLRYQLDVLPFIMNECTKHACIPKLPVKEE